MMLRSKRKSKSPYARPTRAPAAARKAVSVSNSDRQTPDDADPQAVAKATESLNLDTHSDGSGPALHQPLILGPSSSMAAHSSGTINAIDNCTDALCNGMQMFNTPNSLCSITDALGTHVPQIVRQSIYNNEFVHMHKMLPLKPHDEPQQQLAFVNGELVIQPKHKEIKITSVETWTNAFLVFSSIYLTKFPEHTQAILKYMNTIRTAAQRSPNLNWLNYDIQFRLKRSRNHTVDWGSIDAELWLLYVAQGSFITSPQMTNFSNKSAKCFEFNYKGSCGRPYCNYHHVCLKCNNNHPSIYCRVNNNQPIRQERGKPPAFDHMRQFPYRGQGRGQSTGNARPMGHGSNPSQT